jgi:hypothetical protein
VSYDETTRRVHRFAGGLRTFAAAESASAFALGAAVVAALVWCTASPEGYESLWSTHLTLTLGDHELGESLRVWVNSGLMTIFFLVVGLEARREFDLGDPRERRRLPQPHLRPTFQQLLATADRARVRRTCPHRHPVHCHRCTQPAHRHDQPAR